MQTLGFDNYVEPLKIYLQKYRESIKGDKTGVGEGLDGASITLGDGSFMILDDKVEMLNPTTGLGTAQGSSSTTNDVKPGLGLSPNTPGLDSNNPVIFYSTSGDNEFSIE